MVDEPGAPDTLESADESGHSRLSARRRWIIWIAVGAVLLAGGALATSTVIKSPEQAAADTAPPPRDLLVAKVQKRVLTATVIVRGTVRAGQSVDVSPIAVGGEGATAPVITKIPVKSGQALEPGQLLLEVSGRPVFVLKGRLPVYRDLKPGTEGDDVAQLQAALNRLGHGTGGDAEGTFGAGTKAALRGLYADLGYDPLPALPDGEQRLEDAETAVTAAQRSLQDAQAAGSAGGTGAAESGADAGPAAAPADGGDGGNDGGGGSRAVERAQADLADAQEELAEVQAAAGPMLPANEVVFLSDFPARVATVSGSVGTEVDGPVMTVSAGDLVVHALLQEHEKGLIHKGQQARILSELSGVSADGEVASVSEDRTQEPAEPGSGGADGAGGSGSRGQAGYLLKVAPDEALPAELAGQDVRLTVEAASTDGPALVVPVSAVSAGADGKTSVTVVDGTGRQERVPVRTGTAGDGFVQILPVTKGSVDAGDAVVTGVNPGHSSGAG